MTQPVTAEQLRKQAPQGAVDPNVKIPKAVRDAGKRAEVIQQAVTGEAEPSVAETVAAANGATPPAPPAPEAPPAPPAPEAAAPPAPPAPAPSEPPVDWERQFKSLQGRFEQQRDAITQMGASIQRLQAENEALRASAQPIEPPAPGQSLITEEEMQDYGPEFISIVRRAVKEATDPLNAEISNLRAGLGTVQQETGNVFMQRMNNSLGEAVPNWRELNTDPKFVAWSALPDVFSGVIRKTLMQEAWNSGDPNRLIAFFRAYLAEEAATDPQVPAPPRLPMATTVTPAPMPYGTPAPASPLLPATPQVQLEHLAAPGRAHSAAGTPAEKPVYSPQDITRFYTDVAAGRWKGREAQAQAIEADIMAAQREGRILNQGHMPQPSPPVGFAR